MLLFMIMRMLLSLLRYRHLLTVEYLILFQNDFLFELIKLLCNPSVFFLHWTIHKLNEKCKVYALQIALSHVLNKMLTARNINSSKYRVTSLSQRNCFTKPGQIRHAEKLDLKKKSYSEICIPPCQQGLQYTTYQLSWNSRVKHPDKA